MATQARIAIPVTSSKSFGLSWPVVAIVAATIARLALIAIPSHGYDSFAYKHWTWRLVHEPLSQFYVDDGQAFPDHLPGDLWLFKLLGSITRFVHPGIDFYGPVYGALISLLAVSFDLILVFTLIRIGRAIGQGYAGSTAGMLYWCAPAPIFVGSVWGQIDGISTALAIIALGLALGGRFSFAFVALTFCVVVKPQFGMLALPLLIGWWQYDAASLRWIGRVGLTAVACIGVLAAVTAPFDVSLVGEWGTWSILERVQLASDTYTVSTLGAHNLWVLFDPLNWPPDDRTPWQFGLSRYPTGLLLFTGVILQSTWLLLARWRGAITMVLASNVLMFGFFLFMTRMHERYLFPLVALSILLTLLDRRYLRYAISTSVLVFANVALRFVWSSNDEWAQSPVVAGIGWLEYNWTVYLLVTATIATFGWLVNEANRRPRP